MACLAGAVLAISAGACADDGPDTPVSSDPAGASTPAGGSATEGTEGESGTVPEGTDGATEPISSIDTGSNSQNPDEGTVP